jgi:uncharacterized protein (TIGR02117 family)
MRHLAVALVIALAGCATPTPRADVTGAPATNAIYLIRRGWHTDIGVAADQVGAPLARLRSVFPGVRVLLFGFGERAWLLHRQHDLTDMLAALLPASGALLVTALSVSPQLAFPPEDVVTLHVSAHGLAQLNDFISGSFEWAPDGALRSIADGPYAGSLFYASTMRYSGVFTCNTWSAEGLQTAGLPIHAGGTLFAAEVADQARAVAARQ